MTNGAAKGQEQQAKKDELSNARPPARRRSARRRRHGGAPRAPAAAEFADIANTFFKIMLDGDADLKAKMETCARARVCRKQENELASRSSRRSRSICSTSASGWRSRSSTSPTPKRSPSSSPSTTLNARAARSSRRSPLSPTSWMRCTRWMNGLTFDAFKIILDKEAEAKLGAARPAGARLRSCLPRSPRRERNAVLAENKAFFGMGGRRRPRARRLRRTV